MDTSPKEHHSLELLVPPPDARLHGWLREFYGKDVTIARRELLRHRDLSYVERLHLDDALPETLIYKLVLPPWDIEQDLHERILIPSISSSAQLFMAAHQGPMTALFLEDLGDVYLKQNATADWAKRLGSELARLHRAYSYRTDELIAMNVLRTLSPIDYRELAIDMAAKLTGWKTISDEQAGNLKAAAKLCAKELAREPISLVHGDLYAENVVLRNGRMFIIDWSWFTMIGVPILDLACLTSSHEKNGTLRDFVEEIVEAYCFESGRKREDVARALPFASLLERILFLYWLVERKSRGIEGTTVGPVDELIASVLDVISASSAELS